MAEGEGGERSKKGVKKVVKRGMNKWYSGHYLLNRERKSKKEKELENIFN